MTGSINWMRAFLEMRRAGITAFLELGPGNVLANISKRLDRDAQIIDVFDDTQWRELVLTMPPAEPLEPDPPQP
jgi:malonyl CoA-acyl carrier protein transacylase